jgi:hypothetical protein
MLILDVATLDIVESFQLYFQTDIRDSFKLIDAYMVLKPKDETIYDWKPLSGSVVEDEEEVPDYNNRIVIFTLIK